MVQGIEFANRPPTFSDCPDFRIRFIARSLVEATRNYKKEKSNVSNKDNESSENPIGINDQKIGGAHGKRIFPA